MSWWLGLAGLRHSDLAGGAVTGIEPGKWVEMKNQTAGKSIVRIDRIGAR